MQATDIDLIQATRNGDLRSFDELMERYQRLVYRLVASFASDSEGALDLVQEVFFKAYRKLEQFGDSGSFKSWISRIAINEGINTSKSTSRRNTRHEAWHIVREKHSEPRQAEKLLQQEREQEVLVALGELSPRHRLAIELRYLQEMPIREIASALECSEGVARNMLFRGLKKLRQNLGAAS